MLSRASDQRQAVSAAEMSKPLHRVGSPTNISQEHAVNMEFAKATLAVAGAFADTHGLRSSLRVLLCPFPGRGNSLCLVLFPCLSYVVRERVVWVRGAEESLD